MAGFGCANVTLYVAIKEVGGVLVQPASITMSGAAEAPNQLGDAVEPVPGHAWQDAQSWVPDTLLKEE